MRENSANDVCTSTPTCSSRISGNSTRLCSVVNATTVPGVSVPAEPVSATPASTRPVVR